MHRLIWVTKFKLKNFQNPAPESAGFFFKRLPFHRLIKVLYIYLSKKHQP
jgi:hypothetical protein